MPDSTTKICTSCFKDLPIDDYYAHPKARDGRQSQCKVCMKLGSKKHYLKNRGEILVRARVKYRQGKWKTMKE